MRLKDKSTLTFQKKTEYSSILSIVRQVRKKIRREISKGLTSEYIKPCFLAYVIKSFCPD